MLKQGFDLAFTILKVLSWVLVPFAVAYVVFLVLCFVWILIFRHRDKLQLPPSGQVLQKRPGFLRQLFVDVPRRYVLDRFEREEGFLIPTVSIFSAANRVQERRSVVSK